MDHVRTKPVFFVFPYQPKREYDNKKRITLSIIMKQKRP